jgi:SAM-dependent MidA family methyltransferase
VGDDGVLPLLRRVQEECGGAIPFDRFMREALYHPTLGYYTAQIADVGREGDFSTSATLDQGLGMSIAAWIMERARASGWRRIPVIEVGAGSGHLARTILKHLGWLGRLKTSYTIVEASLILKRRQQDLLRGRGVVWVESMEQALKRSGGRTLIFSNELVDAFPCRLFERTENGWSEVGVQLSPDNSILEVLIPLKADDPWFGQFENCAPGHRVERHDSYNEWLRSWRPEWTEGSMLTIDYGDQQTAQSRLPIRGTLRAYWKHQRFTGREIYARFGKQDITADVNFSDLIRWGEELGWRSESLASQREFLETHLSRRQIGRTSDRFTSHGEAGDAFMVLEQSSGLARKRY